MANENSIPTWLKPDLFKEALHDTVGDFREIRNFKIYNALEPGENYATIMLRVEMDLLLSDDKPQSHSFMVKVPHDNAMYREHMSNWDMFKKESGMYRDVIPEMENLYHKKGVDIRFGARSYTLPTSMEYILLEDLAKRGFRNAKRQIGLDMQHTKSSLKKLAQWHAASAVRVSEKGPYEEAYIHGFLSESTRDMTQQMFDCNLKYVLAAIRKLPHHEDYYGKLESLFSCLTDLVYMERSGDVDENEFFALNHGDFWCNNIMYQYDENDGHLLDTYFVDFQMPRYGSVAQDLLYFILSSTQLDVKINRFDEMIQYYHQQLLEHLKILEYSKPLPCLRDIHKSLIKRSIWAITTVTCIMAGVLCDPTNVANMENFVGDSADSEAFREKLYMNERYLQHMSIVLPWLHNRGSFEL
ncbi:uncharacterized protein LOC142220489 [Haematobia irritans]|uniref:uncharacterized protein LOC142220489 n=1 Tax=Haematobia irritans TaxID=7368 RepID=UPI003F4F894D